MRREGEFWFGVWLNRGDRVHGRCSSAYLSHQRPPKVKRLRLDLGLKPSLLSLPRNFLNSATWNCSKPPFPLGSTRLMASSATFQDLSDFPKPDRRRYLVRSGPASRPRTERRGRNSISIARSGQVGFKRPYRVDRSDFSPHRLRLPPPAPPVSTIRSSKKSPAIAATASIKVTTAFNRLLETCNR